MSPRLLFSNLRTGALWLLWLALVAIWIATLWHSAANAEYLALLLAAVTVVLWVVLFFAEGIELAVTDLLDKQPEQLHDPSTGAVLREIQADPRFFIAQRQVFVVAIIAFTSLAISYEEIYLPFASEAVTDLSARFAFSFLLTTFTVLWFCQVTPKQLAILNSELFLRQSKPVWQLIKLVGSLGLPGPSDTVLTQIEANSAYGSGRRLLPSRAAHYNVAVHRYGVSLDRLSTEISFLDSERALIRKRLLVFFLHGDYTSAAGHLYTPSSFTTTPTMNLLALHTVAIPERFDYMEQDLDAIFEGRASGSGPVSENLIETWRANATVEIDHLFGFEGEVARWTIEGESLPSYFRNQDRASGDQRFVALLYEVVAETSAGDLAGRGYWSENLSLPCRFYEMTVSQRGHDFGIALEKVSVTLNDSDVSLPSESESLTAIGDNESSSIQVRWPLQGTTYTVHWQPAESEGAASLSLASET